MPAQRADPERAVRVLAVVVKARDVVDVDDQLGRGEAKLHERHQALAPGQHLRVIPAVVQQRDGFAQRARRLVAEPRRIHMILQCSARDRARIESRGSRRLPGSTDGSGFFFMRVSHRYRQSVLFRVRPRLLVWRPWTGHRLASDLEIVDELGPGPDGGALAGLRRVFDQLVQTRIPVAMPVGLYSHGTLPAFRRAARHGHLRRTRYFPRADGPATG